MHIDDIQTTKDIKISNDPLSQVIGQERAVEIAKICAKQRRNLLLVGPPGIGKSMLAQALSTYLPKPNEQVAIVHNPKNPERPFVEVMTEKMIADENIEKLEMEGKSVKPNEVPTFVAERLGFRCPLCGAMSEEPGVICPSCGVNKFTQLKKNRRTSPFGGDMITEIIELTSYGPDTEVHTTKITNSGDEEVIVYRRSGRSIAMFDQKLLEKQRQINEKKQKRIIVPLKRKTFIHVTGASETELLGDVRHDPYGGHSDLGTPPYMRVVSGAIHDAHEGVLFVDELPHIGHLQSYLLTAMQEKRFPIVGRNPQSSGASVRVEDVPCDFIFIGACNINEMEEILPAMRSRIIGNGYEILLNTTMPDNEYNRIRLMQFVAQEISIDNKIPHATRDSMEELIKEAKVRAQKIDDTPNALTLRLRDLGGIIRFAGDLAVSENEKYIEKEHMKRAITESIPIERQLYERYGSIWKGSTKDRGFHIEDKFARGGYV